MFQAITELALTALFIVAMIGQVIMPILHRMPIFPAFRNREIESEIRDLNLRHERKLRELEKARILRELRNTKRESK